MNTWGWEYNGESGGSSSGFGVGVGRGSLLLKPVGGGAMVQVGRNTYIVSGWLLVALLGAAPALVLGRAVRRRRRRALAADGINRCVHCGYDLRATPDRCPECGKFTAATE